MMSIAEHHDVPKEVAAVKNVKRIEEVVRGLAPSSRVLLTAEEKDPG
jgi:hypothetical protein